ncbi:MAG: molybdopterin-dependent oxidoreductase, partial [Desulfohalobiaceae bacterium]|nr:molybdopterin-dependent oxidoreductase [Desulfohalobiaceae bacterium]
MEEITISINGRPTACPPGTSILQAAVRAGISIPTLCFHEQLKPYGACRMCLVEDEKSGRLLASCVAPVMPDMVIQTHSPRVVEHRRNIIRLMIAEHPESCIVCSKGNRCRLRQLAADIGLGETGLYPMPNSKPLEEANPFIVRDLSKCILCASCIRADHELVAVGAIDYNLRGFRSRPSTALEKGLEQSCCTFCGTCVSICPTGALSVKNERFTGTPETEGLSICGFCGVGCQLRLGIFDQNIVEVNPAQTPDSVNTATLCVRGHFAHDFLQSRQRLLQPWLKKDGRLEPAPWDEALGQAADRLLQIKNEHGPQSIGLLGSSKCSNEENYLFQKLARASLGTSHVDNGGYVYGQAAMQYFDALSQGMCRSMPLKDLEASDLIVVLGADPGRTVPVAGYAVKRAAERGVPVILANTLPTELDWFARLRLPLFSSNGLDHLYPRLLTALAAAFLQRQAPDSAFLSEYTRGFDQFQTGLARIDPRGLAKEINIAFEDLHRAADFLTGGKTAFV